jgi:hypothetical protein
MTITRKKRPRDPLQLGKLIVDIATGQVEDREDDVVREKGASPEEAPRKIKVFRQRNLRSLTLL